MRDALPSARRRARGELCAAVAILSEVIASIDPAPKRRTKKPKTTRSAQPVRRLTARELELNGVPEGDEALEAFAREIADE